MEEIISESSRSGQIDGNQLPRNEASKVIVGATSKKPTRIRKKIIERGRHRYKSFLETNKKKRKRGKSTQTLLNADLGGNGLIYGMHALSQESSILNSHITTSPSNLTDTPHTIARERKSRETDRREEEGAPVVGRGGRARRGGRWGRGGPALSFVSPFA